METATEISNEPQDVIDGVAFAKLYGEPLFKLPNDLYIRPMRLKCFWKRSKARSTCCST